MADLPLAFRRRCNAIASRQRTRLGLADYDPLPARHLAIKSDVALLHPIDLDGLDPLVAAQLAENETWDGALVSFEPPKVVTRPDLASPRFESTVMHEIAHILLRHPPTRLYWVAEEQAYRTYNDRIEKEAAYLGGCLQIPRGGIVWARQLGLSKAEIAAHFGASEQMVQWRINATPF